MIRAAIHAIVAWLLQEQRHAADCPYRCPRHSAAWEQWRARRDRPGFRAGDYR